jgi:Ca-activated chloride channel family protein
MSIRTWLRMPRIRRGLAASAVILSAGGLILARTPVGAAPLLRPVTSGPIAAVAAGENSTTFSALGAHGTFALSHTHVLAGSERRFFAELDLTADVSARAQERAPLSIAVVLDTSGSMDGEKIEQAKQAVVRLIRDLRDDDEIAFVRYSTDSELVQPLARAGTVRNQLISKVQSLTAEGGTNIAPALRQGLRALAEAGKGRVLRVVLASDGLDSTRAASEAIARESAGRGVTISSMGIGLDFDASYMAGVARSGHGNFAFVNDLPALTAFLHHELEETASTTIASATARIKLPAGVRFVRAVGAEAKALDGGELELALGSMFAGDERRAVIELAANVDAGEARAFDGRVSWNNVGGDGAQARFGDVAIRGSADENVVAQGRDGAVLARAMSSTASLRQIEATEAYAEGDVQRAQGLIDQNIADLHTAQMAAPAAAATALEAQANSYDDTKRKFASAAPKSAAGSIAAKQAVEKNTSNIGRQAAF